MNQALGTRTITATAGVSGRVDGLQPDPGPGPHTCHLHLLHHSCKWNWHLSEASCCKVEDAGIGAWVYACCLSLSNRGKVRTAHCQRQQRAGAGGGRRLVGPPSYCTVEVNGSGIELYGRGAWIGDAQNSVQEMCCLAGTLQI